MGKQAWLQQQFAQPIGYLTPQTRFLYRRAEAIEEQSNDEERVARLLGDPEKFHMYAWWTQVMTSPDLLRQRVALALSEIFVVSNNVEEIGTVPYAMSGYYDSLLEHSFGNFRELLKAVSLNPAMGIYLSHMNNIKADPVTGRFPDENYAREVMQLFSIGLFELNNDGSRRLDAQGNAIATYGQQEIRELAKIFTGLSFDSDEGFPNLANGAEFEYDLEAFLLPMKMYDAHHSQEEKRLLNGTIVPAGQSGMADIDAAIDNLFNHPNVGPFIGKQLIQRLVKSNPSPAYVSRVTAAFNGETGAPRGDMQAFISAILLDPEAQVPPTESAANAGRLREPFVRLVRLKRSFNATTSDRNYAALGLDVFPLIRQYVMYSPSVFNFFQPNYAPNGEIKDAGLLAPEFQITNASTIVEIKNLIDSWLEAGRFEEQTGYLPNDEVNFTTELALADDTEALLTHLDTVMTYGTLSENTRSVVRKAINNETEALEKVRIAVYLIAVSPDFAVAI